LPSGTLTIVIEPSMGFGTGHHASTRLCLEAIQRGTLAGAAVLDVGAGSGVLGIAAARLGAARVLAIDNDADAIESARENVRRNAVEDRVRVRLADVRELSGERFDLVVANLTGALLRQIPQVLGDLISTDGRLVLSGFTASEAPLVRESYAGLAVEHQEEEGGWSCLTLRRT
jgi:ribosomal protein L11 methyltransferase